MALSLAALANVHLLGLVLAVLLAAILLKEKETEQPWSLSFFFLFGAGVLLACWQIFPPGNHPMYGDVQLNKWLALEEMKERILTVWVAFCPIPDLAESHFWHTNALVNRSSWLARTAGAGLLLVPAWVFRRRVEFLWAIYILVLAVMILCALKSVNYERFCGFIFLAFLLFLWVSRVRLSKRGEWLLGLMLTLHAIGGIASFVQDWHRPFSDSRAAATFLQSRQPAQEPVVAEYCFGESIQAYLPSSLLYPELPGETFCRWEVFTPAYLEQRRKVFGRAYILSHLARSGVKEAIWIHYKSLQDPDSVYLQAIDGKQFQLSVTPIASFTGGIKLMEQYYLYRVRVSTEQ